MNRTARAVGFLGLSAIAFAGVLVFSSGTGCIDTTPIYVEVVDTGARAVDEIRSSYTSNPRSKPGAVPDR